MQCSYSAPQYRPTLFARVVPESPGIPREALSRRVSLVDRIVEEITRLVISRELRDGDPLPSQDEMARQFGVSRPSLREALHSMQVLGLIEARQGSGTFIRDRSRLTMPAKTASGPDYPTVAGLFITLYDVEPAVAALAAINTSDPGANALRDCLERGRSAANTRDLQGFLAHDLRFHSIIAELSHNRMLAQTVEVARGLLDEAINASIVTMPTDLSACMAHHERVAEAVVSRNAKAAYQAMQAEIDYVLGHSVELIRELLGEAE